MLILALDTSSPSGSVAILRDENLLGAMATRSAETYSSRIFRHLQFLLEELAIPPEDFDVYAVASGPGSFTGLRVGLAAVKGWAEVHKKPIAAVSALEAVATQSRTNAALVVPVLDARRKEFYWGLYRRQGSGGGRRHVLKEYETVGLPEAFVKAIANLSHSGELAIVTTRPDLVTEAFSKVETSEALLESVVVEQVSSILAPEIGYLGWMRAQQGNLTDSLALDANYLRRSDAELHSKGFTGS